ncbi:type I 3-dehydroquinate dehydratase [Methanobacterium sp. ACI-7]|uniref:type I 3-dehydroquinate dehydratase n=1 Tax=unclassified Methanobacterium TaxID=2627676 RepID=UPI0039C388E1
MFKKPMICAPIVEKEFSLVLQSVDKAIKLGADILEFRIDTLKNPDSDEVQKLVAQIDYPLIITNRIKSEGGSFKGSEEERVEVLIESAPHADFVDIELQTEPELQEEVIRASRSTIISYHDFKKTPSFEELLKVIKKQKEIGDIAKFAVMPNSYKDTLTVLNVLSEVENTIGIAMGDIGKYTRLIAPLFGSPLTFASIDKESAPGQLDIQTTKDILRKLEVIN